ncbi:MAG TPA: hypothetical protein VLA03_05505, partial [Draconibacterium sp.]|nr:hypothetical protein [Draconibacterium sp.]
MKLKFLLLFIGISSMLWAQEPYRNLVITEARMINGEYNGIYFEITNMGNSDIDLSQIKFANIGPQGQPVLDVWNDPWIPAIDRYFYLPESVTKILKPGESYVMTQAFDFVERMTKMRYEGFGYGWPQKRDIYEYSDFLAHRAEKNDIELVLYPNIKDSTTVNQDSLNNYGPTIGFTHLPQIGFYIEDHFAEGDSAVIDQVGNMFDNGSGENSSTSWDVAGVAEATTKALLVRKYSIKQGNLDFFNARGVGEDDSEWMAVTFPEGTDNWRDTWWSVHNHGAYVLDANTLEPKSDEIKVDFAEKTLTVPWGIRRLDDIMHNMKRKPGVAWIYELNESVEDSLLRSAQTGDKLTVYVFGENLSKATFDIIVKAPADNINIVVPVDHKNLDEGPITENAQHGKLGWPRVTNHESGIDTITGGGYGLPYSLRVDSLFKYLEKPANASWEIVSSDGNKRADLNTGDKLRVTAQNGDVKEYFIETQGYVPNHNANLASITWPDISISEIDQIIYGWKGDTIPNFNPNSSDFRILLPYDFEGIPALVFKTVDVNATVAVKRATSFEGSIEDRTISFEVTAEDDSVKRVYNVELVKDKNPANLQPFYAEPFLSELVVKTNGNNVFAEICNPGNQPLDLSNYMFCSSGSVNPSDAITSNMDPLAWNNRFEKYVPGYKWVSESDWTVNPGILVQDLNVSPFVQPGDV